MRILIYTTLYPTTTNPVHGIFVGELVEGLARLAQVRVVAPENALARLWTRPPQVGSPLKRDEDVLRCRFWNVPKLFKSLDGRLLALCSRGAFLRAMRFGPDLIHAHYAYPDAAAAAQLAAEVGLPLVVTCHGSDIQVLAKEPTRGRLIAKALGQAAAVVAVSRDLAGKIARLGVDPARIHHIPNGVDLSRFFLADKGGARRCLGLEEGVPWLVAAGRLEAVKGYDRLLRALALLDNVRLVLVGDGGERQALSRLARELGLAERVRFAGTVPHDALAPYYQAADALVISSHSEGWPTVIHEALACGTPVVAPAVGGIPEALAEPEVGLLLASAEPGPLADGIRETLDRAWDPSKLRRAAVAHDWTRVAARHLELYAHVLDQTPCLQQEVLHHGAPQRVVGDPDAASAS